MRRKSDCTCFWNTGQGFTRYIVLVCFLLVCTRNSTAYPDFIDNMSRQFFGLPDDTNDQQNQQYQQNPEPFSQMFGAHSQPVPSRPPPQPQHHIQRRPQHPPQRQGYYPPHPGAYHEPYNPQPANHHQSHPTQRHPPYNGPPPVYGQQHGFGQIKTEGNETKTEGFPRDGKNGQQHPTASHPPPVHRKQHVATEYHIQDPHQTAIEYHHPPATSVEYQQQPVEYQQPPVEYHHVPEHAVEYHPVPQHPPLEEHHGPAIEILSDPHHHEPPAHVEYHHPPEHHHYPEKKPKRFHISFHQSPDYKIVDKHLKLPPVKFRFHINPKIIITSNTKDPLDKKHHHDEEHDLEPYPPPDAFSDHNAPPSYNEHTVEHYPTEHHYPVQQHYPAEHHYIAEHPHLAEHHHHDASGYSGGKFHPLEEHPPAYPRPQHVYDLSGGHSHVNPHRSGGHSNVNPHRSGGHYEPTFKIKTRPIIFTEPPPTPRTTTKRPTTTTARTTTTTTTTTTARPPSRTRARLNARNPGFSVAFTQAATTATTSIERQGEVSESTTSTSTTRRSIFGGNSERERENGVITARRDESSSTTTASTTPSTTTTTTTTMEPTTTTTMKPTTSTTTTTTPKPTITSTTTITTTPVPTTKQSTKMTTTTTQMPTTTSITTTTAAPPTSRATRAEETTPRTTPTVNVDANEIDMRKDTDSGRRRPEPLKEESLTTVERTETFNFENSESVKVIETTMLIDGKNQTVKFYYITQPVKLPLDVFQRMTGQKKNGASGINVIKIRDKRFVMNLEDQEPILEV